MKPPTDTRSTASAVGGARAAIQQATARQVAANEQRGAESAPLRCAGVISVPEKAVDRGDAR